MGARRRWWIGGVAFLLGSVLLPAGAHESGTIQTAAGSSTRGFAGDGGPATAAELWYPYDAAVDPTTGDLYFTDSYNQRIRMVDHQTGIIQTIAGNGVDGFGGDGGPAHQAILNFPRGLIFDDEGNLLFADSANQRIRRIDAQTGIIQTIVGDGSESRRPNGDGRGALDASLYFPFDIALSHGDLYIADTYANRIRRVDHQTGIIQTVAGTGTSGFAGDEGPAEEARIHFPTAIAFDPRGRLHIVDTFNHRIRMVDEEGVIHTVAGKDSPAWPVGDPLSQLPGGWPGEIVGDGGRATEATLAAPYAVDFDPEGRMLIADTYNYRIRRVEADGTIHTVVGSGERYYGGDGGPATKAKVHPPFGMGFDHQGNLFFAQSGSHVIRRVQAPFPSAPALLRT